MQIKFFFNLIYYQVINLIDPHKKLTCRLFRDSCVNVGGSYLIKHLEVLNRELKNIVLIDNASYSFAYFYKII